MVWRADRSCVTQERFLKNRCCNGEIKMFHMIMKSDTYATLHDFRERIGNREIGDCEWEDPVRFLALLFCCLRGGITIDGFVIVNIGLQE